MADYSVNEPFIEIDAVQITKHGQRICGDVFLQKRNSDNGRITATLSDGMGSGIKANVLASLTAHMGQQLISGGTNLQRYAESILDTLPVCRERQISYATFTLAEISREGRVRVVEYDNPPVIWTRGRGIVRKNPQYHPLSRKDAFRKEELRCTERNMQIDDRLIFYSDGVTQSGMGTKRYPLGWRTGGLEAFVKQMLNKEPAISASDMARKIACRARRNDGGCAGDDISCAVAYLRLPRCLLVATGPPYDAGRDAELAAAVTGFTGRTIISGGTTAAIVSRECGREIRINLKDRSKGVPPSASMDGISLITEGMLTLGRAADLLESGEESDGAGSDAAEKLVRLLKESDSITFLVGTRINEAHHDPDLPFELGIRRSLIQRLNEALTKRYLKKTEIRYL